MPTPIFDFFKSHQAWLVAHAVDADRRKHMVDGEDVKHYIDLDRYHDDLDSLQKIFPLSWREAVQTWPEAEVRENGIGPWNAQWTYRKLVAAFAAVDTAGILRHAADLGHYVGDLHVPLHTTENYNGQLTGQDGIHGLWETQIPEASIHDYALNVPPVTYCTDVSRLIWTVVFESHAATDSVLRFERELTKNWSQGATYAYVERGRVRQRLRSPAFVEAYAGALDGQVERRMNAASARIAQLWWSAWIDAGEPKLPVAHPARQSWWSRFWVWLTGKSKVK